MQNMGWICPRCGMSNAPFVPSCQGCAPQPMNGATADFDLEAAKSVGERLKQARLAKGFENATEAAKAFGWNENTYRSHENGMRGLKPAKVREYAKAFNADPTLIMFGDENKGDGEKCGSVFRSARKLKNWSQQNLADQVGISQTTIDKIERGLIRRSRYMLKIARKLDIPIETIE